MILLVTGLPFCVYLPEIVQRDGAVLGLEVESLLLLL